MCVATDACERVTAQDLGNSTTFSNDGILANAINPPGESVIVGSFRVDSVHVVCEAQHPIQDRYIFTSVLVTYTCSSTHPGLTFCDGNTINTDQLTLVCVDNAWSRNKFGIEFGLTMNSTASTSTELASNCIVCINPYHSIVITLNLTVVPDTHCVGKFYTVNACSVFVITFLLECSDCNTGLGRCYGTFSVMSQVCCNFFYQDSCVESCPTGFFFNSSNICDRKFDSTNIINT